MKNRLRELREERRWSQAELGEALEVSRQTIHALETGKYDPSLPLAFKVARLFGLAIEDVFDDGEGPTASRGGATASASARAGRR